MWCQDLRIVSAPVSVHEACLQAIQAGFNPLKCDNLNRKVRTVLELFGTSVVERLRIPLPEGQAVNAYVIPGPLF